MKTKDYELILDSLQMTAVYVIREDNHKILYYNKRVREVAPNIEEGMVCHEIWKGTCDNCPLLYIGDKDEARSVNYDDPFGKAVEIAATRIMWEEEVPAFMIAVTPYAGVENHIYHKVLRGNLTKDSFSVVKVDEEEVKELHEYMTSLTSWFSGMTKCGYIYEEDIKRYEDFVCFENAKAELKKGAKRLSCIYRRKSGDVYRWHHLEIVPDFDYSDDNQKVMICVKDIHDTFNEGLEREEINIRNQEIINSLGEMNFAIYVVDLQNGGVNIVRSTDKIRQNADTNKYVWDHAIKGKAGSYIAPEDQENVFEQLSLKALQTAWKNGEKKKTVMCRTLLHGEWRYITISAYFKENGQQDGYAILAFQDVDEQTKRDMESIEKASIINSLSSMFFATYYVNLENATFRPVTQKAEVGNVLGDEISYTQGIRMYAEKFISEEDREKYLEQVSYQHLMDTLSEEQPVVACEYRMVPDENNRRAWIRSSIVLSETTVDGRPKRALYVAQDVTESKLREEQEQQALKEACEAANYANAAKSDFMSRMSHDIRTPINAIVGMTAIAGKYLEDKERVEDCLRKITVSSKHLLSLINEVLDMSKIESGKIDLMEEEVNLSELIGSLVTMIRPVMQEKNHNLDVHITNVDHELVVSDAMRMQQIFTNILGNSAKYTNPGGNIEMEISEKPSNINGYGCYEFVFRDNGIGMSKEFLENLFEPFARAEDSRVNKIEGTGLGMTIARNIARKMNGDIAVESELGKGTKFVVTLILKLVDTEEPNTEMLVDLPVLVVDDDENASEMTCLVLENIGMKGEYVLSGREAVQRVWEHHQSNQDYFAVILDWKMPEMDGIETARAIRAKVGPDVPIIILSAYDWSAVEEEARRAGVNGFISKPLFKSRLVYLFNQIMDKDKKKELPKQDLFTNVKLDGKRVLLVEDIELNREIVEEIIGDTGVMVESAENGREAVEMFEKADENYYDMILMDVQMPVMNGYDATRAIRKLPRKDAATIPIIAMTANAFMEDIQRSKSAGMNEHLTKPLDIEQLMKCLGKWLGGEKA